MRYSTPGQQDQPSKHGYSRLPTDSGVIRLHPHADIAQQPPDSVRAGTRASETELGQ